MDKNCKIFIAADDNIIGISFIKYLKHNGFANVFSNSSYELDLLDQKAISSFFDERKPEYVILTSVKSGGMGANIKYPAEFIYQNLQAQNNIIHSCYVFGVKKLLFLASSCIYPYNCPQPIREEYLLSGELEKTSEPYSIAKIAGIKMCQAYNKQYGMKCICVVPATVYGPGDHFDLEDSHVLSSLLRRFYEAKINNEPNVVVWGTGKARREFIYALDLVDACVFLIDKYDDPEIINVGPGRDISIEELAEHLKTVTGFRGEIVFDPSKPDGVFQKLLDNRKITSLGWKANISFEEGLGLTYSWYKEHLNLGEVFQ